MDLLSNGWFSIHPLADCSLALATEMAHLYPGARPFLDLMPVGVPLPLSALWHISKTDRDTFEILSVFGGLYLNIENGCKDAGTKVQLWDSPCEARNPHSVWKLSTFAGDSNVFEIQSDHSGRFLNVCAGRVAQGSFVCTWDSVPGTNAANRWLLIARSVAPHVMKTTFLKRLPATMSITTAAPSSSTCVVCLVKSATHGFAHKYFPSVHVCLCKECSKAIPMTLQCLMCRRSVYPEPFEVFFS